MKAIILAAGLGTRLGEMGKSIPKCLIEIKSKTLLEIQTDALIKAGIKKEDIIVVIGNKGECWTKENNDKIKQINEKVIVNYENDKTNQSYSLKLAVNKLIRDDIIIIDGDSVFHEDIIKKAVTNKENLVLAKERKTWEEVASRNKILFDNSNKVLEMGKYINENKISPPYQIYGCLIKIKKDDFDYFKELINFEKYKDLNVVFLMDDFCKSRKLYFITDNRTANINTVEELKEAEKLIDRNFIILMFGYTAVGKSTLARKIAKNMNADIFHSAVVRKELKLDNFKNSEEADKFFDYRNNLRQEVDRKVYTELANKAEIALKNGKNIILDAGYFFSWQRQLVYDKAKDTADIFVIKVKCDDENEIRKRLAERTENFGKSALNETPSWNTYLATKMITEQLEKDSFYEKLNIIEYDTFSNDLKLIHGEKTETAEKIMNAITPEETFIMQDENFDFQEISEKKIPELIKDKFVIALDFDGVITNPHKFRADYLNEKGYKVSEEQSSAISCIKLGVSKEDYEYAEFKADTETPEKLPLERDFLENFARISNENIAIFLTTSRRDNMIEHLQEYLNHHKIKVSGIFYTREKSKANVINKIKANVFVDDSSFKLMQVLDEKKAGEKCLFILYRNIANKSEKKPDKNVLEAGNWNELADLLLEEYKSLKRE